MLLYDVSLHVPEQNRKTNRSQDTPKCLDNVRNGVDLTMSFISVHIEYSIRIVSMDIEP